MQANLRSLFAGKREAAEVPAKRGPGRPPKVSKMEEAEKPDEVLEALRSMPDNPEDYDERLRVRHRKRKADTMEAGEAPGSSSQALVEAFEKPLSALKMPGCEERSSKHEGPQVKLMLCKWFAKKLEEIGGSDEMKEVLLQAVAEQWGVPRFEVVGILENEEKWKAQCKDRGVSAEGLRRGEAQLLQFLRKSLGCKGDACRAKGGGKG